MVEAPSSQLPQVPRYLFFSTRSRVHLVDPVIRGPIRVQLQIYTDLFLSSWACFHCLGISYFKFSNNPPLARLSHVASMTMMMMVMPCHHLTHGDGQWSSCNPSHIVPRVRWWILIGCVKCFVLACLGFSLFLEPCWCFSLNWRKHPFYSCQVVS